MSTVTEASGYNPAMKDKFDGIGVEELSGVLRQTGVDFAPPTEEMYSKGDLILRCDPAVVETLTSIYQALLKRVESSEDWKDAPLRNLCQTRLAELRVSPELRADAEARATDTSRPWGKTDNPNHPYCLTWRDVSILARKVIHSTADIHFSIDYETRLNANFVLVLSAKHKSRWQPFNSKALHHEGEDFRASVGLPSAMILHRKTLTSPWEVCKHPSCFPQDEDGIVSPALQLINRITQFGAF